MRQYIRSLMSYSDFKHAIRAASYILTEHLHSSAEEQGDHLLLEALNCSMIIAYCRPFSGNNPTIPDLPARLLAVLDTDERSIHDAVLLDRNKVLAHSDYDALQMEPVIWKGEKHEMIVPVSNWGLAPLTEPVTRILSSCASKLQKATFDERMRLEPELKPYFRVSDDKNLYVPHKWPPPTST